MSLLSLLLDIQILLIGLQVDNFIHCSWIYVFIPFIVFFITLSLFLIERKYDFHERWRLWIVPIIIFLFFIPFFIFLGLKLDGKIHWNYRIVFIPLFIQVIFHYLGLFWNGFWKYDLGSQILLFLILPAFWISILILWILYLERKGIHHVYYPLIPIYLLLLFSFIPSYFSITKLVKICFQKD
ncbi:fam11a b protein [Anaeramoeba ignava]|uniref:Fam11a b protein n=1 Tax=Anaeramoeba ignava TaxID=1746090 RepID=A0A9Q0LEC0_ANAIG|nr:fam11a b protein [Anaeramoeba ignava]